MRQNIFTISKNQFSPKVTLRILYKSIYIYIYIYANEKLGRGIRENKIEREDILLEINMEIITFSL